VQARARDFPAIRDDGWTTYKIRDDNRPIEPFVVQQSQNPVSTLRNRKQIPKGQMNEMCLAS